MKRFLQGQSKGKKTEKLRKLGSSTVIMTTTCTTTSMITSATVPPLVALQAGREPKLPEVPKELPLLFLEESEELLVSKDPQSDLEPVMAGQASQAPPPLSPESSVPSSQTSSTPGTQSSSQASSQGQAVGPCLGKHGRGAMWANFTMLDDPWLALPCGGPEGVRPQASVLHRLLPTTGEAPPKAPLQIRHFIHTVWEREKGSSRGGRREAGGGASFQKGTP